MWRSRLPLLTLSVLLATPAFAQIAGNPFEISGQGGWFAPDARARMNSAPLYGGTLGWRPLSWMVIEGQAMFASADVDTNPGQTMDFTAYGVDFRFNMRAAESRIVPFALVGLASATSSTTGYEDLTRGSPSLGLGTLLSLGGQRSYLRVQVRDSWFRERDAKEFSHDFSATVGIHYVLGGKARDSDLDGVREWLDQCPATPLGAKVDARGCPNDSDGDGVMDGLDKCPDTSAGLKVDAEGCPVEFIEKETELLDTGMIRLQDVNFETNKAALLPESLPVLDIVGAILKRWPELKIEIGGHTDARGSNAHNQRLSEARAQSVLAYLTQKYPELKPEQFKARGYGEARPLVPNTTALNMAKNRRVEFVVQNKDVLKRETERRRLLQRNEAAPPDSSR